MGQQYSCAVKVLQDHALVLKDLAVLNHEGLSSKLAIQISKADISNHLS